MLYEKIYLHENEDDVYAEVFCCDPVRENRPAVLVLPGGGYAMCSDREAEPIARLFMARGYNCVILNYSVGEKASLLMPKASRPLLEASEVMSLMRKNADKWHIDPEKIAVIGFSAGGHLAGTLGTMWHDSSVYDNLDIEYGSNKPNAMILSYPVLRSDEFSHEGTMRNLLGNDCYDDKEMRAKYDVTEQVSELTPPAFVWHTFTDQSVPIENVLKFCKKMHDVNVPVEMHILPYGCHGLSTLEREVGDRDPYNGRWTQWVIEWLEKVFY